MSSATCLTMMKALYLGNALWHLGAWYSFVFHTELMMASYSRRRNSISKNAASTPGGDDWHHDLLKNLGYVNLAPAILAYCRLFALFVPNAALSTGTFHKDIPLDVMALFVLAVAHGSEAYWNFTIGRENGRWRNLGKGWGWITVGDATLTVLNVLALFVRISGNRDDGPKGIWLVKPEVA